MLGHGRPNSAQIDLHEISLPKVSFTAVSRQQQAVGVERELADARDVVC